MRIQVTKSISTTIPEKNSAKGSLPPKNSLNTSSGSLKWKVGKPKPNSKSGAPVPAFIPVRPSNPYRS